MWFFWMPRMSNGMNRAGFTVSAAQASSSAAWGPCRSRHVGSRGRPMFLVVPTLRTPTQNPLRFPISRGVGKLSKG